MIIFRPKYLYYQLGHLAKIVYGRPIRIVINHSRLDLANLCGATRVTVGRYMARDPPHFQGDQYHGHCKLAGGGEASWNVDGPRRHLNRFPANDKIPMDAKLAIAKVLGVDKPEVFGFLDNGETIFILKIRS